MVVIFVRNSAICGIFFYVRILRNFKSSLYPKKCCYQVTRMILAVMRIVLCIKIVFIRVKLQFTWQIKIECGFGWNKNDNHVKYPVTKRWMCLIHYVQKSFSLLFITNNHLRLIIINIGVIGVIDNYCYCYCYYANYFNCCNYCNCLNFKNQNCVNYCNYWNYFNCTKIK